MWPPWPPHLLHCLSVFGQPIHEQQVTCSRDNAEGLWRRLPTLQKPLPLLIRWLLSDNLESWRNTNHRPHIYGDLWPVGVIYIWAAADSSFTLKKLLPGKSGRQEGGTMSGSQQPIPGRQTCWLLVTPTNRNVSTKSALLGGTKMTALFCEACCTTWKNRSRLCRLCHWSHICDLRVSEKRPCFITIGWRNASSWHHWLL